MVNSVDKSWFLFTITAIIPIFSDRARAAKKVSKDLK